MAFTFDPAKNAKIIADRGLNFELVEQLDWASAQVVVDRRKNCGEAVAGRVNRTGRSTRRYDWMPMCWRLIVPKARVGRRALTKCCAIICPVARNQRRSQFPRSRAGAHLPAAARVARQGGKPPSHGFQFVAAIDTWCTIYRSGRRFCGIAASIIRCVVKHTAAVIVDERFRPGTFGKNDVVRFQFNMEISYTSRPGV
jgi:hypothetical protein